MKTLKKIFFPALLMISCSEIDNYGEPNGAIHGKLIDNITNANLQSEQPNGFIIKLFEKGGAMNSPIVFTGKPDGSFENAWIFQNEYMVVPVEGAFFPIDTATVQVGGRTEVNFTVTPFLAVTDASIQAADGKITAVYRIARAVAAEKIVERKTLVSKIPTVNNAIFDFRSETNLADLPDEEILATSFTDEVAVPAGEYYVRVAVRTDNALRRYNYSETVMINVP
ncbi:DUF3823 domain-containing protein [Parapedobacter sp. DT-150]|uniref:DUF3823 domain-containing protein n=1 Tax=Parapedobacter sp. DT-150 TaxID=3396162 RepID=UPI003F1B6471